MKATILILALLAGLVACGGDEATVTRGPEWSERRQGLVYAYPAEDQSQVPLSAPVLLRFSSEIVDTAPEDGVSLERTAGGDVSFSAQQTADGRTLVLVPNEPLAPLTEYRVTVDGVSLADGEARTRSYVFSTAALEQGPDALAAVDGPFRVLRWIPDGDRLPMLDFSSLRLQFSRPLDASTVSYGDSLLLEGPAGTVPARLLVDGSRVTVDPVTDLDPGTAYTLTLDSGIRDRAGTAFPGDSRTFVPRASGSRSWMVQAVPDSGGGTVLSELTGEPINRVPLQAVLLGEDNASQQSGNLRVELAHIPTFPDTAPLRIPRGTLLSGTAMNVLIGGEVPAGFDSGEVGIRFVSDAMGFMFPNPRSPLDSAPRQIVLYMDVAIHTGEPRANGAVTQDLLHLELVGTAIVRDGELVVDAVSVAEPRILGVEKGRSLLSFHMRSYVDQENAPLPEPDTTDPQRTAWVPGDEPGLHLPGDPVVLYFSEPLDAGTLTAGDNLTLTDGGAPVPFHWRRDGASLVIEPEQPLERGIDYRLVLGDGIADLAGNPLAGETLEFRLPASADDDVHAPVVLSVNPGFPCVPEEHDLADNDAGRCQGGRADDDHLPLARHPVNRSLRVTFSRAPDPDTVNEDTFTVEQVDAAGDPVGDVAGTRRLRGRTLTFIPDQPWQPGALYRYTLHSGNGGADCGTESICKSFGPLRLPLQTRMLAQTPEEAPGRLQGGPDMPVFFRAAAETGEVSQPLRNLPTADINANLLADPGEPVVSGDPQAARNSTQIARNPDANPDADGTAASGNAVADINVGCGFDAGNVPLDCPDEQYGFITGNLDVDVVGYIPPAEIDAGDPDIPAMVKSQGGVLVYVNPTRVLLSSVVVYPRVSDAAATLNFEAEPSDTGPQVLRIRYDCDAAVDPCGPPAYGRVRGWIVNDAGTPRFLASLNLYLDAPRLDPQVNNNNTSPPSSLEVTHDLRSRPLTLELSGEVAFLDDGRLRIEQTNANRIDLDVMLDIENGLLDSIVYLAIPVNAARLNFISAPVPR